MFWRTYTTCTKPMLLGFTSWFLAGQWYPRCHLVVTAYRGISAYLEVSTFLIAATYRSPVSSSHATWRKACKKWLCFSSSRGQFRMGKKNTQMTHKRSLHWLPFNLPHKVSGYLRWSEHANKRSTGPGLPAASCQIMMLVRWPYSFVRVFDNPGSLGLLWLMDMNFTTKSDQMVMTYIRLD